MVDFGNKHHRLGYAGARIGASSGPLSLLLLPKCPLCLLPLLAFLGDCDAGIEMTVTIADARYTAEHEGRRYYFCCQHCQRTFEKEPQRYAHVA